MKETSCCVFNPPPPSDGLPCEQIRELVPESQAYMDLLAFERKLDQTIMRKRVDIQEALKRPMKVATKAAAGGALPPAPPSVNSCDPSMPSCQQQKRKLRLYISNTFNPARPDADDSDGSIASWELRVEGKLLDDVSPIRLLFIGSERPS